MLTTVATPFIESVFFSNLVIVVVLYQSATESGSGDDAPSLGITSSANIVRFLVAFQCGMSATCITLFKWLVCMRAAHSPSWLATFSGEPTATKFDLLTAGPARPKR